MKAVIQCSATKHTSAGSLSLDGMRVDFVAHPELQPSPGSKNFFRPDDAIPSTSTTWREHLLIYNHRGENKEGLVRAVDLYAPRIYRLLLHHVGPESLFILSAGWGLIKASFLIPDYDITFSGQAESWKRRTKRDEFQDFAQLTQSDVSVGEPVYFFGGKDYLPLFYALTRRLAARKVIYFASGRIPKDRGCDYIPYETVGTNWHYRCARDFIEGTIAR